MHLSLAVRDLVVLTWAVEPSAAERDLPPGYRAALGADGRALVSIAAFRARGVRLGSTRAPSFSQLGVRTYVDGDVATGRDPGAFFLSLRVSAAGLGAIAFGAPCRYARIRLREGALRAPGLGVDVRYRRTGEAVGAAPFVTGPAPGRSVAYYQAAGVRRLVTEHEPFAWERLELDGIRRVDPLPALGFDPGDPLSALYCARADFAAVLPPELLA